MVIRSLLFAPANRVDLVAKFPRSGADAAVIDLEDGTPEQEKAAARSGLAAVVSGLRARGMPGLLLVRINAPASPHAPADLEAALAADVDGLVIPKLTTAAELQPIAAALDRAARPADRRPPILIGLIETVAGVINAHELARSDARLHALAFGGEDFISDIGGRRTPEGREVLYARSQVVIAAKAAGLAALDQVVVDIRDEAQFRRDAVEGRSLGYTGKMCLLPRQVALANEIFTPDRDEIDWSRRLLAAAESARAAGWGVIEFEGRMIDPPLVRRARAVVELAARLEASR
ncbi:MAG: CoA ester lyase [Gemmatimonadetes bacterium]|nr:CoA ester lyase [Gemmatimonadota bacterium]